MANRAATLQRIDTEAGAVEYADVGEGRPLLFVHGSPGGADQGALMGAFAVAAGFRVLAPSRPGYLGTPLTSSNGTPDAQAGLHLALLDALGIDACALMCWSGGGPSSYRLAATQPSRITTVVALAAVSSAYSWEHPREESTLTTHFGRWLMAELARHAPEQVIKTLVSEEGDLTKDQVRTLTEHIWNDPAKREFVVELSATVTGDRGAGLKNDQARFPEIADLGLGDVVAPVLLVHGTEDRDVPPAQSDHASRELPHADLVRIEGGTHIATWTDPTSADVQARAIEHLRRSG